MNKLFFWECAVLMTACTSYKNDEVLTESGLSKSRFQTEINGEKTDLFVLKNKNKMEVCITNYGGRIVSVMVPDQAAPADQISRFFCFSTLCLSRLLSFVFDFVIIITNFFRDYQYKNDIS